MASNSIRFLIAVVLFSSCASAGTAHAAEPSLFDSGSAWNAEVERLTNEAYDMVSTPFQSPEGAMLGVATFGAAAVSYLLDEEARDSIRKSGGSSLDTLTDVGSTVGSPLIHFGIASALYAGGVISDTPGYRTLGEMVGEAALLSSVSAVLLKGVVGRARPLTGRDEDSFRPLQLKDEYDSMPSLHTSSSFAIAAVLSDVTDSMPIRLLSYAAAVFVGFSRVYQDKHWLSDVVVGAALGEACGRAVVRAHSSSGAGTVSLVPMITSEGTGLRLVARW